jgi:hypothetical protein
MDTEKSQPKREAKWAATGNVVGVGPPKPLGAHITPPQTHMAIWNYRVSCLPSLGFVWLWSDLLQFFYSSIWNGSIYSCILEACHFLSYFTWLIAKRLFQVSQTLWTWSFE